MVARVSPITIKTRLRVRVFCTSILDSTSHIHAGSSPLHLCVLPSEYMNLLAVLTSSSATSLTNFFFSFLEQMDGSWLQRCRLRDHGCMETSGANSRWWYGVVGHLHVLLRSHPPKKLATKS